MRGHKLTKNEAIEEINKILPDNIKFIEFINDWDSAENTEVKLFCTDHNKFFEIRYKNLIKRKNIGCEDCEITIDNTSRTNKRREKIDSNIKIFLKYNPEFEILEKFEKVVNYKNSSITHTYLNIRCKKHNTTVIADCLYLFDKKSGFLDGTIKYRCPECIKESNKHKLTPEVAQKNIENKYKDLNYDFSKIKDTYTGRNNKVTIVCPKHGEFQIIYHSLFDKGCVCPKCHNESRRQYTEIEAKNIVNNLITGKNNKFGLKLEFLGFVDNEWKGNNTKLILKCNIHNTIWETMTFHNFLSENTIGCIKCSSNVFSRKYTPQEAFNIITNIQKSNPYNYDFSKIKDTYISSDDKVTITCPKHGDFEVNYTTLLKEGGGKCPECIKEELSDRISIPKEEAIKRINDRIDYLKLNYNLDLEFLGFREDEYKYSFNHLILKCKKHNIIWDSTLLNSFIKIEGIWCPMCREESNISTLERKCRLSLSKLYPNETVYYQYHLNNIYDKVIKKFRSIYIDFYLESFNTFIEIDGEQHFNYVSYFCKERGGYSYFVDRVNRDNCLKLYCCENSINLLRIPWCDIDNIDNIIKAYFEEGKDITTKVDPIFLPIKYEGEIKNG